MIDATYIRIRRPSGLQVELRVAANRWAEAMQLLAKYFTDGRDIGGPVPIKAKK